MVYGAAAPREGAEYLGLDKRVSEGPPSWPLAHRDAQTPGPFCGFKVII